MYELRERNELCDVTLKVNNENFHAHKVRCYSFRLRPVPLTTNNRLLRANSLFPANILSLPSATKLRRLCFLQACVCPHGGLSASAHAGIPHPQQTPPWSRQPPPEQTPPRTDPRADTPPQRDGHCCGRYTSYWNAFLL